MSDRLAISASFSVLMMAMYVLFGNDAVRMPVGPGQLDTPLASSSANAITAPTRRFQLVQ